MPTINQLIRKGRRKPKKKAKTPALQGCAPEERRVCKGIYIDTQKTQLCTAKSRQGEVDKRN